MKRRTAAVLVAGLQQVFLCASLSAQGGQPASATQIVHQMLQAEAAAWRNRQHFQYRNEERSNRTNGRLWNETVVETSDGSMQRLVSVDGKPLSGNQEVVEDQRIAWLADHPREFRRKAQRHREDEARMPELLREIPNMFLFDTLDTVGNYSRIAFHPNPSFHEESYQDRVVHAMEGVLIIHQPDMRLCELDAHLEHNVEFGFGVLAVLHDKTTLSLKRGEVSAGQWTTTRLRFHVDGSILLLKTISRDLDSRRSGFRSVAPDLNVAQAAAIVRSTPF